MNYNTGKYIKGDNMVNLDDKKKLIKDTSNVDKHEKTANIDLKSIELLVNKELSDDAKTKKLDTVKQKAQDSQNLQKKLEEKKLEELPISEIEKLNKQQNAVNQSIDSLNTIVSTFKTSIEKFIEFQLKRDEEVKGRESISRGEIKRKKFISYYDMHFTISQATAADPNDFDSPSYQIINAAGQVISGPRSNSTIRELQGRVPDVIRVINDGSDTLFVIEAHEGSTKYTKEEPVYAGQYKDYWYIADLRYRSPTLGLPFRVMEYETEPGGGIVGSAFQPIDKAVLHNQALPAIGANWLAVDLTPTNVPTNFRINVSSTVAGTLSIAKTRGGVTVVENLNAVPGPILKVDSLYEFNIMVHSGDSINFRYTATGGFMTLRVQEIDAAVA